MSPSPTNTPNKKLPPGIQHQVAIKNHTAHQTATNRTGHLNQAVSAIATDTLQSAKSNAIIPRQPQNTGRNPNNIGLQRPPPPANLKPTAIQRFHSEIAHVERMTPDQEKGFLSISRYNLGKKIIQYKNEYKPSEKIIRLVATGNIHENDSCYFGKHLLPEVIELTKQKSTEFITNIKRLMNQNDIHGRTVINNPLGHINYLIKYACDVYDIKNRPTLDSDKGVPKWSMATDYTNNKIYMNEDDVIQFGKPRDSRATRINTISSIFHEVTHVWQAELAKKYDTGQLKPGSTEEKIAVMYRLGHAAVENLPKDFLGKFDSAKLYAHAWHEQQAHMAGHNVIRLMTEHSSHYSTKIDPRPIKHYPYLNERDNTVHYHLIDAENPPKSQASIK